MKIKCAIILLYVCNIFALNAHIETVTVSWLPIRCTNVSNKCVDLLTKQFNAIPSVSHVTVDEQLGTADLKWKLNAPFYSSQVSSAMRMVGVSIKEIRLKVQGHLKHTEHTVTLISQGDSTHFELLNPVSPLAKGIDKYHLENRRLQPELLKKLIDLELSGQLITIEGPLFTPERNYLPPKLVVDQLSVENKKL